VDSETPPWSPVSTPARLRAGEPSRLLIQWLHWTQCDRSEDHRPEVRLSRLTATETSTKSEVSRSWLRTTATTTLYVQRSAGGRRATGRASIEVGDVPARRHGGGPPTFVSYVGGIRGPVHRAKRRRGVCPRSMVEVRGEILASFLPNYFTFALEVKVPPSWRCTTLSKKDYIKRPHINV